MVDGILVMARDNSSFCMLLNKMMDAISAESVPCIVRYFKNSRVKMSMINNYMVNYCGYFTSVLQKGILTLAFRC